MSIVVPNWIVLGLVLLAPVTIWLFRTWIDTKIRKSVESAYEEKLEALRSELRTTENGLARLQDDLLSSKSSRQSKIDEKRISAVDRLWIATLALRPFRSAASFSTFMKMDRVAAEAQRNPQFRKLLDVMKGGDLIEKIKDVSGEEDRPFLPPPAWAAFSAYRAVLITYYIQMYTFAIGVGNKDKLVDFSKLRDVVAAALPHRADYLATNPETRCAMLVDELEENVLNQITAWLDDMTVSSKELETSSKIIKQSRELLSEVVKATPPAAEP